MKRLDLGDGIVVTLFDQPPVAFNPMTASDTERTRFGFPSLVDNAEHRERYSKLMGQLNGKFHYVQPNFEVRPRVFHGPRKPAAVSGNSASAGTETSGNWSGAVVYAPQGDSFKWLEGDFVVPNVGAPAQGSWFYSASWIGLDGDGSGDVCQAGVQCEVTQTGSSVTRNIYPWWEWFPLPEVKITNFAVSPGDLLTMILCTASGAGSTSATLYLTNRTSGQSTSFGFNAPAGTKLVGNSAEWIVEAPTVGGSQSAIADYGEVFFSVCEAVTVKGVTVNGGTGNNINLSAGGKVVSAGTLITPTVAQCWYEGTLA